MPRAQRREQLLDAALRVIVEQGYGGLGMEAVAREAGIAKTVVYSAFADRDELLGALLEREQERAISAVAAAIPSSAADTPPLELIRASLLRYLEAVARDPGTWRLILLPVDGTPPSVRETVEGHRERFRAELEGVAGWMLDGFDAGHLDTELLAHLVLGSAEQLARLTLADAQRYSPQRLAGFVTDLVTVLGTAGCGS